MREPFLFLFSSVIIFTSCLTPAASPNSGPASGRVVNNLELILNADKTVCRPGDEIRFTITFVNHGTTLFRLFEDQCFMGSEFVIRGSDGNRIHLEGGFNSFSPKAGLFLGRTFALRGGERRTISMVASVDHERRLVFSDGSTIKHHIDFKKRLGLPENYPDKYIGCGRIFPLLGPGKYEVSFLYEKTENDKKWRFPTTGSEDERSTDRIWTGTILSNRIVIELKE